VVRTQISLEPEDLGWLRRQANKHSTSLAGAIRQLIRNAAAQEERGVGKYKTVSRNQRNKLAERFTIIGCIKDGRESDAKLAEDYLYGEGEVR
jgi:hypothetical protein